MAWPGALPTHLGISSMPPPVADSLAKPTRPKFDKDFIILSEFSEHVGPIPLQIIPESGAGMFDTGSYSVRIMSSDFQTVSEKFSMTVDSQVLLSEKLDDAYAYVHYFCLNDIRARGYIRQFCFSYITSDTKKLNDNFEELHSSFSEVTTLLKCANHRMFGKDLEHELADLEHTKMELEEEGWTDETKRGINEAERYEGFDFGQMDVPERDPEVVMNHIAEIKEIMSVLRKEMEQEHNLATYLFLEKQKTAAMASIRQRERERETRDRLDSTIESQQSFLSTADLHTFVHNIADAGITESHENTPYVPKRVLAHMVNRFSKELRTLESLSSQAYAIAQLKLAEIHKSFSRSRVALEVEKEERLLLDPYSSLLSVGRIPLLNMLQGFRGPSKESRRLLQFYPYTLRGKTTWSENSASSPFPSSPSSPSPSSSSPQGLPSLYHVIDEKLPCSKFDASFMDDKSALSKKALYLDPIPNSTRLLELQSSLQDSASLSNFTEHNSYYNTPEEIDSPELKQKSFSPVSSSPHKSEKFVSLSPQNGTVLPPTTKKPSESLSRTSSLKEEASNEVTAVPGGAAVIGGGDVDASNASTNRDRVMVPPNTLGFCPESVNSPSPSSVFSNSNSSSPCPAPAAMAKQSSKGAGPLDPGASSINCDVVMEEGNTGVESVVAKLQEVVAKKEEGHKTALNNSKEERSSSAAAAAAGETEEMTSAGSGHLDSFVRTSNAEDLFRRRMSSDVDTPNTGSWILRQRGHKAALSPGFINFGRKCSDDLTYNSLLPHNGLFSSEKAVSINRVTSPSPPLTPGQGCVMALSPRNKSNAIIELKSKSMLPFVSSVHLIEYENQSKPGRGIFALCREHVNIKDLLFCLLHGRPLVISGNGLNDLKIIRRVIRSLWLFVPGHTSSQQVIMLQKSIMAKDLSRVKLMGYDTQGTGFPYHHLKSLISHLDHEKNKLYTPPYSGEMLLPLVTRTKEKKNKVFLLHAHSVLLSMAMKAYVYYHGYCCCPLQSKTATYSRISTETAPRKMHTVTPVPSKKMRAQFLHHLGVKGSDVDIIEYFVDVIRQQQLSEWKSEELQSGNPQNDDAVSIVLQHQKCADSYCKLKKPY